MNTKKMEVANFTCRSSIGDVELLDVFGEYVYEAMKNQEVPGSGRSEIRSYKFIDLKFQKINGEIVFKALEEKDCIAESVFEQYIKYLGEGLINIIYIFRPDVLVIGGGLSEGEALWRPLEKYIAENSNWMHREKRTQIRRARLGNDAGIIGATYLKNNVQAR